MLFLKAVLIENYLQRYASIVLKKKYNMPQIKNEVIN